MNGRRESMITIKRKKGRRRRGKTGKKRGSKKEKRIRKCVISTERRGRGKM